ncbi:ParA family protein [Paracoccus sp. p3-h83]|uniref:ParA family protein n=1 Tax=Paracoccus sp. p3-h83 TaxID=3342805 RepID=UPI0035B7B3D1
MTDAPRIIAVTNQKGGVGKTTTAINLGAALAERQLRVLLIDLDPQGNASTGLGIDPELRANTTYDLLIEGAAPDDLVLNTVTPGLDVIPANADLASADIVMSGITNHSFLLRKALDGRLGDYDYVLIDCPPSLSLLTINAMTAADSILVPLQAEFFALEGLSHLMLTLREVRERANPDLRIAGIVLTMADSRNNLSQQVEADARATMGDLVFQTVIPRNVRLSEAPSHARPVLEYDTNSRGSEAYRRLAAELDSRNA